MMGYPVPTGAAKENAPVRVGFGAADITPSVGTRIPGGFRPALSKGVHDKLWAVACVISDGTNSVALVGTDTLHVPRTIVEQARRIVQKETGIIGENVLIGASHTHSGGYLDSEPVSDAEARYIDNLPKAIASAVSDAWKSLRPAEVGIGTGKEGSITFNRRFLMSDGRVITHPGKPGTPHHREIVRPAGPIDPDVGVLAFRGADAKLIGVVVNFACHNTVMSSGQFSADYAGQLRKHLQRIYGESTPVVFLLGACGDITQVDNRSTAREFGPAHADMMGSKLAAETSRTIDRMKWLKEAPVAVHTETVLLPLREEFDVDRERPAFGLGSGASVEEIYSKRRKDLEELRRKSPRVATEVQAIRVGPLALVTHGSEYFCDDALRIKKSSPFATTWVVTLANDSLGYIPTAQACVSGGYEPRGRKFSIDAGQRLLEAAVKALKKVAPQGAASE
jgi:neutral ceramidase